MEYALTKAIHNSSCSLYKKLALPNFKGMVKPIIPEIDFFISVLLRRGYT